MYCVVVNCVILNARIPTCRIVSIKIYAVIRIVCYRIIENLWRRANSIDAVIVIANIIIYYGWRSIVCQVYSLVSIVLYYIVFSRIIRPIHGKTCRRFASPADTVASIVSNGIIIDERYAIIGKYAIDIIHNCVIV